jgi:glycosyltransferase involved in cell wall biosynthesis
MRRCVHSAKGLHRDISFDAAYSGSLPMYAHVAGYCCSRSLGLPWIANINDPWNTHLFPEVEPKPVTASRAAISRYWLRRTLRCADLVTYPSLPLHRFHERFAGVRHHAEVIPHIGYAVGPSRGPTTEFRIVHAGKLGMQELTRGRSMQGLLTGLSRFLGVCPSARERTRVVLVGPEDPGTVDVAQRVGLEDVVRCVGRVSYEESLKHIASASVCVLVEGKMTNGIYFPSKLADYIAARKPILALSPACGVVAELARERGIRRVDTDNEEAIASAIDDFYRAYLGGCLAENSPSDTLVRDVSPVGVIEKFLHAVEAAHCGLFTMKHATPTSSDASCANRPPLFPGKSLHNVVPEKVQPEVMGE